MLEIKVTIELPGVPEAINHVAEAILANKTCKAIEAVTEKVVAKQEPVEEKVSEPVAEQPAQEPEVKETKPARTRKKKEQPIAPVEQPEDAPPLAEVPAEENAVAEESATQAAEDVAQEETAAPAPEPEPVQAPAPIYTIDQLSRAGTALLDQGKMAELLQILQKHNAVSIMDLSPDAYVSFAEDLKAIGANLP